MSGVSESRDKRNGLSARNPRRSATQDLWLDLLADILVEDVLREPHAHYVEREHDLDEPEGR